MKQHILTQRNILYLNILLAIIFVIATIFVARDIIAGYFERKEYSQKSSYGQSDSAIPKPEKQLSEYAVILSDNPFGFPGGEIRPLTGSKGVKTQQGDIMLVGTVVGPKELSYGIFRDAAGMQEVFKVGDPVFDFGKLHSVERDKVVVKKDGRIEEIFLDDVKISEVKRQASATPASVSSFAQRIGRSTYMVDQARLQQAIANPGQMMTDARLKPNIVSGKEEGFVLSEVKPGGIYQSLGLQNGDVLLRINEYDISNPERALQAFTALKGMDRVQVDLMRSGSRLTMTYQIK